MSNPSLTPAHALRPPSSILDPHLARALASAASGLASECGHGIPADRALSPEDRVRLSDWRDQLRGWLAPAQGRQDALRADVALMFAAMKSRAVNVEDARIIQETFVRDLADLPTWIVQAIVRDARAGKWGDGWRPTQADVRHECVRRLEPLHRDLGEITKVLKASVLPPADPERTRAAIVAAARSQPGWPGSKAAAMQPAEIDQAQVAADLEANRDQLRRKPIDVSPALAKSIDEWRMAKQERGA